LYWLRRRLASPSHTHSSNIYPHHDYYQILRPLGLNKRSMRCRLCSPSLCPICPTPTFAFLTYINPTFHQPLSSRSPTKRHVHDFISWLLFGRWIPDPCRGLDHIHKMELESLRVSEIWASAFISSSSLGAGAHVYSINTLLAFLDRRNQHTYFPNTLHFFLSRPIPPFLVFDIHRSCTPCSFHCL